MNNVIDNEISVDEIFVNMKDYESRYTISTYGKIKSLYLNKFLKPWLHHNSLCIMLYNKNTKSVNFKINYLVANNFIENPHNLRHVKNKDNNPLNNHISNLEWIDLNNEIDEEQKKNEVWKDIKDWEKLYQISNLGRLRSLDRENDRGDTLKGQILKPRIDDKGYHTACLSNCEKMAYIPVHRLVGHAFLPNPRNLWEVNHIDSNPSNNLPYNLEFCTHRENIIHAYKKGRMCPLPHNGEENPASKLTTKDVVEIKKLYNNEECSIKELSNRYNVAFQTIYKIIKKETWKHVP